MARETVPFYKENVWYLVGTQLVTVALAVVPITAVLAGFAIVRFTLAALSVGSDVIVAIVNVLFGLLGIAAVCWLVVGVGAGQIAGVLASTNGKAMPFWELIRESFMARRAIVVALGLFAYGMIVVVGFLAFIVPGLYLLGRGAYLPYVLVRENLGITDAFKRTWFLTRGYWWVTMLRFGWLGLAVSAGSALIAMLLPMQVRGLAGFLWQMLVVSPFAMVFARRMYEAVRDRKAADAEAFHPLSSREKWQVVAIVVLFLIVGGIQSSATMTNVPSIGQPASSQDHVLKTIEFK